MTKRGPKVPAVSYRRVSGDGQIVGDGPKRQSKAIEDFAKAGGYKLVFDAFDKGVSGTTDLEDRDELPLLFDYIIENKIKVCIVENSSRLSRRLMVGEIILEKFKVLGCKVFEANSGMELTAEGDTDETKVLVRQVLAAIAEFQKQMEVKKLAAARKRMREAKGKCEGRKRYGEEDENEREVLGIARSLRRKPKFGKRKTWAGIAEKLNELGYSNRSGGAWTGANIRSVVEG